MRSSRWLAACLAAGACAVVGAGCGSDKKDSGGSSGSGGAKSSIKANAADPASAKGAKGSVTYCTGKDTSGAQIESVKLFNQKYASQGLKAKLLEFPESADEQRNQFIQRQRAKSPECDIFYSDVVWTAEFAQQGWLLDMSNVVKSRQSEFIPSTLETTKYQGKYWGVPKQTDAGFLYYRKDKIKQVPQTWQDVYAQAKQNGKFVYQGAPYEGLTVDYLEIAFAAGGKVLSDDGKKSVINSPENVKALQFMVDGIKSGAAPKAVTTYMEENARRSFEANRASLMRNWPYAYALGNKSDIKNKFAVAPLPSFEGGGKAGILGGHNLVISAYSKNKGGAVALINYLTSTEAINRDATGYSLSPVLMASYDNAAVKKALPFSDDLKQAVMQAKSRPVTPVYATVSEAIYRNVNKALAGQVSPQDALKTADSQINKALTTF